MLTRVSGGPPSDTVAVYGESTRRVYLVTPWPPAGQEVPHLCQVVCSVGFLKEQQLQGQQQSRHGRGVKVVWIVRLHTQE